MKQQSLKFFKCMAVSQLWLPSFDKYIFPQTSLDNVAKMMIMDIRIVKQS